MSATARDVIAGWLASHKGHLERIPYFDGSDAILSALDAAGFTIVPKEDFADRVSAWVMHDNHTFSRLSGSTVMDLVQDALRIHAEHKDCMLCSVTVLRGKKEVRRVGPSVHFYNKEHAKDLADWIKQVSADPDIPRLLAASTEPPKEPPND